MKERLLLMTLSFFCLTCLSACTEKEGPEKEPEHEVTDSETVYLGAGVGSASSLSLSLSEDWHVQNETSWIQVTPNSGFAGDVEISVLALNANGEIPERVAFFDVLLNDGTSKRVFVVQAGQEGIILSEDVLSVSHGAGQIRIPVQNNIPFTAEADSDWLRVSAVELDADSTLLEDSVSWSALKTSYVVLDVDENTADERRNTTLTLKYLDTEARITVWQNFAIESDVDWSREFFKTSLAMRFTGSGCKNCPMMGEAFKIAKSACGDRLELFNIHGFNTDDPCYYENARLLADHFDIEGYPTGIFNMMATLTNEDSQLCADKVSALVEEAVEAFPAMTGVTAVSFVDGNVLTVGAAVAFKEAGSYRINAFIMESGYIGHQQEAGDNYQFDNFVRRAITDDLGEPMECTEEKSVIEWFETIEIPSVVNRDNAYIAIFITRENDGELVPGNVSGVTYSDYGTVVDNIAVLPLSGEVGFRYE